jgi:hypothetical protein
MVAAGCPAAEGITRNRGSRKARQVVKGFDRTF